LKEGIATSKANNSYPKWSDEFLTFCEHTANATLDFIDKKLPTLEESNQELTILSLIQGWEVLHTFIKPVLDADTLKVPYPLIQFLSEHIGGMEAVKGSKIVIELIPELNYLQERHTSVRIAMRLLKIIIGATYEVPRLGFLGLPYSQSKSLFMNCLLYHEAGHFIAEEMNLFPEEDLPELTKELKPNFKRYANWAGMTIQVWMEELFADIIAVKLIGPAYTYASMELLRLVYNLSRRDLRTFSINHPADALRFREQLKILKADNWESCTETKQWQELEKIANIRQNTYLPPDDEDPSMGKKWLKLIQFLCRAENIKKVHDLTDQYLVGRDNPCDHFVKSAAMIRECLQHGIVPSWSGMQKPIPHPTAIINGAVFFLLSEMDALYEIIPSINKNKAGERALLENRLEMWCIKGIEDWLLRKNKNQ
jgi:hypothetical protein